MNFIEKIRSSVYDPSFYRQIPKETFGKAISYYLLFCIVITMLRLALLVFPISSGITTVTKGLTEGLLHTYPNNLQITIHHGQLAINQPQPYSLPVCIQNDCQKVIIDTQKPNVNTYLRQKDVFMVLTKDTAYIKNSSSDTRVYDLSQIGDVTVNKQVVTAFVNHITPWTKFFIPAAIIFMAIMLYIGCLFKLIYIFFLAFLLWLLAKKFAPGTSYGGAYKIGLHAVTLGMFIALIIDATSFFTHLYTFPFMETLISLLVFILNFNSSSTKATTKKATTTKKKK